MKLFTTTSTILVLLFFSNIAIGQELKCNVSVNAAQIQGTNRTVFENMQKTIYEFINNTVWTHATYTTDERIECNIQITINNEVSTNEYDGTIQIQSRRPIYNTSYHSVLLNFKDTDFKFKFDEFEQLEFNESVFTSNLISVLAYYSYIIIGLDSDSYSLESGSEYFEKAQRIVSNAQSSNLAGWKAFEQNKKNRYWLVENILNRGYQPLREVYYKYHRQGLDVMEKEVIQGQNEILSCLELLQKVHRNKPDSYLTFLQIFFDAKNSELVDIFSEAYDTEKTRAVNILKEINPSGSSTYDQILKDKKND